MGSVLVLLLLVALGAVVLVWWSRRRRVAVLDAARMDADHWYGLLGGQVMNVQASADSSVRQALADASERYTAAGSLQSAARTPAAYRTVSQVSLEGLHFIRAARAALGLDPGPDLPATAAQAAAGNLQAPQSVLAGDGRSYLGQPEPGAGHRYYYPGGVVGGRAVPGGWYGQPFWKGALLGGAAVVGGSLLLGGIADAVTGGFGGGWGERDGGWGEREDGWGGGDSGGGDW